MRKSEKVFPQTSVRKISGESLNGEESSVILDSDHPNMALSATTGAFGCDAKTAYGSARSVSCGRDLWLKLRVTT
jgi:hypothetical protein